MIYRTLTVDEASLRMLSALQGPSLAVDGEIADPHDDAHYYRARAAEELVRADLATHPKARTIHLSLAAAYLHRAASLAPIPELCAA